MKLTRILAATSLFAALALLIVACSSSPISPSNTGAALGGTLAVCPDKPEEEVCGDKIDNDCDGKVDEDCTPSASLSLRSVTTTSTTTAMVRSTKTARKRESRARPVTGATRAIPSISIPFAKLRRTRIRTTFSLTAATCLPLCRKTSKKVSPAARVTNRFAIARQPQPS